MISKETIELVRDRTDIVAVVSERVPSLKRHGRRFTGLCPFHKEKTPSFSVNQESGVYHCFGCKESGDAFKFLELIDGFTFVESVRYLAERAGIPIEEEQGPNKQEADRHKREREEQYSAMQTAASWFERQLREHPHRKYAIDEMERRALDPASEAAQAFRLGYAPSAWDELAGFLKKQGVSPALGETVGLLVPRSSGTGYYDRFRHRLMFAVMDVQGRVVAFSGRALAPLPGDEPLADKAPAKYINSPETPIYLKKNLLFGLWQARNAIRQGERAIVVEGNFDVVSLHARGVQNVVAPLGTAFTEEQGRLLRRFADNIVLLFDGDAAGRKAARAAESTCDAAGLEGRVAVLPDKTDPDDFVRRKGADALRSLIDSGKGLIDYLIEIDLDPSFSAADLRERAERVERVAKLLARQKDPLVHSMAKAYADQLAGRLDLVRSSPEAFGALVRKLRLALASNVPQAAGGAPSARPWNARLAPRRPGQEERKAIVGALLDFPGLLDDPEVGASLDVLEGVSAQIVAGISSCTRTNARGEKALDSSVFLAQMPPTIQTFASARLAAPAHDTIQDARALLIDNAKKLRRAQLSREVIEIAREQERTAGDWDAGAERAREAERAALMKRGKISR
jgi:DNA primase